MKLMTLITAFMMTASSTFGAGTHTDSHAMAIGMAGEMNMVTRTVEIIMKETEDYRYVFEPSDLTFKPGETVLFKIRNEGELEHEFVIDEFAKNAMHKIAMANAPEMEHADPNAIRLDPGMEGEIIWTFGEAGEFEIACLIPGHYESGMHGTLSVSDLQEASYTKGTVTKIDANSGKVTISHEALINLDMPAMTMVFRLGDGITMAQFAEGQAIEFVADRVNGKLVVASLK